jgi:uncharacterized phage-associated protein
MFVPFDTEKTLQTFGVVLRSHRYSIASKLRILKLLYIADREYLKETGTPILGCRTVAMDHGPLHSEALDLINGKHINEPRFAHFFDKYGYMVQMHTDPGVGKLARAEIEKLQQVSERYASLSDWELAHEVSHQFPEWQKRWVEGSSATILLGDILDAVGRSDDKSVLLSDLDATIRADRLFGPQSL